MFLFSLRCTWAVAQVSQSVFSEGESLGAHSLVPLRLTLLRYRPFLLLLLPPQLLEDTDPQRLEEPAPQLEDRKDPWTTQLRLGLRGRKAVGCTVSPGLVGRHPFRR